MSLLSRQAHALKASLARTKPHNYFLHPNRPASSSTTPLSMSPSQAPQANGTQPPSSTTPGMTPSQFRTSATAAIDQIIAYTQSLSDSTLPVLPSIQPGYLAPLLPSSAPEQPLDFATTMPSEISSKILPGLTHWQHPSFMAFFPACSTFPSILAEMYSAAFTAPAFNWLCSPACTELETVMLDWMGQAFGLPGRFLSAGEGGGVIQGSASEAIVTCMVAARERMVERVLEREGVKRGGEEWEDRACEVRARCVALSSDQAHSSTAKGARIAGTRYRSVKTGWEGELRLTVEALEAEVRRCEDKGLLPYYLTVTLGTTSTCAVDPLAELGRAIKEKYPDMWVHLDAAYAGTALICPELRTSSYHPALTGDAEADFGWLDSFNTNMHKWLLTSFDASLLWVQKRTDLTNALSINPAYLQNKHTDSGLVTDYRDWQIPLGRRFRALKIWFVVRTYGLVGLREHIRKGVRLGEMCADMVKNEPGIREVFEVLAGPTYGLTCFRIRPDAIPKRMIEEVGTATSNGTGTSTNGVSDVKPDGQSIVKPGAATQPSPAEAIANDLTKRVADIINEKGQIFLTSSSTNGKTFIRIVCGNENSNETALREAVEACRDVARELLEGKV